MNATPLQVLRIVSDTECPPIPLYACAPQGWQRRAGAQHAGAPDSSAAGAAVPRLSPGHRANAQAAHSAGAACQVLERSHPLNNPECPELACTNRTIAVCALPWMARSPIATALRRGPYSVSPGVPRYTRLSAAEAQPLWERAYEEAAAANRKETAAGGGRRRRVHMLTGLVLPVWEAVQSALADLHRASDRRLRVLRLQTTGTRSPCLTALLADIRLDAVSCLVNVADAVWVESTPVTPSGMLLSRSACAWCRKISRQNTDRVSIDANPLCVLQETIPRDSSACIYPTSPSTLSWRTCDSSISGSSGNSLLKRPSPARRQAIRRHGQKGPLY